MRSIVLLAPALLLTGLAQFGLPLPLSDPLRDTLVMLPLIVGSMAVVGIWTRTLGSPATPVKVVTAELVLLAILVLCTLARAHLGLRSEVLITRVLAAGFALLLLHRLAWLVAALRVVLDLERSQRVPFVFFALPLMAYLAVLPWTLGQRPPDGDAPHYLLLTHSLAYDLDTDLRNNYENGDSLRFMHTRLEPQLGDPQGAEGQLYSRHNVLLPLLLAPFYRLFGLVGTLVVMAALTSLTAWYTLELAGRYRPDRSGEAITAWAILAFTAPFILFSYQIWVEIPAALLVLIGWLQILRLRTGQDAGWKSWMILALSMLALPLLKFRFLLIATPLAVLAIWQGGRLARRVGGVLLLLVLTLAGGILIFNQLVFDNPLKYHDIDGLLAYSKPVDLYLQGLVGLFFDCAFGLFSSAPIWALLIPAAILLLQRRERLLFDLLLIFLPYLLALAPRGEWFGGWSPPFRYGIVMLPFLALMLIYPLAEPLRGLAAKALAALAVGTVVLTILWLVVPGWTFNLAHGRNHLLDQLSTFLGADVVRFFPSSTRLRIATVLGPIASLAVLGLGWRWGVRSTLRRSVTWGAVVALMMPAALVWAAHTRPTRIVEFEDPWVQPDSGKVFPDLWVIYRPRYRGGWTLPSGGVVRIPLVAGGDRFDLELDLILRPQQGRRGTIELQTASGRVLGESTSTVFGKWMTLSIQGVDWPPGQDLYLVFRAPGGWGLPAGQVTLDRARFDWR